MDYILKPENKALMDQIIGLESVQKALAFLKADHENSIAEQIELVQIPARRVLSALTMLEIDEYVLQLPGKRYVRNVLLSE